MIFFVHFVKVVCLLEMQQHNSPLAKENVVNLVDPAGHPPKFFNFGNRPGLLQSKELVAV